MNCHQTKLAKSLIPGQSLCRVARSGAEDIQHDEISETELFEPITCLYRVRDYPKALRLANDSPYGLTACIHTGSIHRATEFTQKVQAGVAVVNAGTYSHQHRSQHRLNSVPAAQISALFHWLI